MTPMEVIEYTSIDIIIFCTMLGHTPQTLRKCIGKYSIFFLPSVAAGIDIVNVIVIDVDVIDDVGAIDGVVIIVVLGN